MTEPANETPAPSGNLPNGPDQPVWEPTRIYDAVFFCSFFANVFMLISISLLFRYADFIKSVGGDEWHLGWIVGFGSVGAILFRIYQGNAIDRFGPMTIWLLSLTGLIISNLLHVGIQEVDTWQIYAVRLLMNLCIAGTFGSWLSFVSLRVPENKVAEVIGVVGSSGFVGMATGPIIGDWIFATEHAGVSQVDMMFYVSAGLLCGALLSAGLGGFLDSQERKRHGAKPLGSRKKKADVAAWDLMKKYHPGFLLIVAGVMGMSISIPGNFLRPFVEQQGIQQIKVFFIVYNVVAFVSRVSMRRAPEVLGLRNTILLGLFLMALSMVLYTLVDSTATMVIPAIAGGLAHSFLFPSVVAGGTAFFPKQNRGLATSLVLAMYDIGMLIGSPLVGISVTTARSRGLPEYPLTFCLISGVLIATGLVLWKMYPRGDGVTMSRRG